MIIDRRYVDQGLITERCHPEDPDLLIYNYTNKTNFDRLWDDTTRITRGLIVRNGRILAMPFRKFYNINEMKETMEANLPADIPEITVKIDGAMGCLYLHPDGKLAISTRGVFDSLEALWATEYLRKNYDLPLDIVEKYTVMFEICSPAFRHIIYHPHKLYLTGIRENVVGNLLPYSDVIRKAIEYRLDVLPNFMVGNILKDLPSDAKDIEGWVAMYPKNQLLVKIKTDSYRKLHRLYQSITFNNILKLIKEGEYEKILEKLPKDLKEEAIRIGDYIQRRKEEIWSMLHSLIKQLPEGDRKTRALWIKKNVIPELQSCMFMWASYGDSGIVDNIVFKIIKKERSKE